MAKWLATAAVAVAVLVAIILVTVHLFHHPQPRHDSYVSQATLLYVNSQPLVELAPGETVQINCWESNGVSKLYNVTVLGTGVTGDIGANVTANQWDSAPHCGGNP
jgi:hypothetical protein